MASELTVIQVDDGRGWRGGQFQVSLLARGLARRGISQKVVVQPASPMAERLKAMGVEVVELPMRGELDGRASRALAAVARESNADILHAHTAHAHSIARRACKLLRRARDGNDVRLVVTRRVDFPVSKGLFSRLKYRDPRQNFIAISEAVCEVLIQGGVAGERIDVVHSGVPSIPAGETMGRAEVRKLLGIDENHYAIVTTGALTDHKGHRWLIEAAPAVVESQPQAHIWILGEGELRGKLESQVASLRMAEHVHLPGHIPDARLKLSGFDLYVSPSHLEGLGTANLDAMLAGLPIVAAGAGGVTDVVRHGVTGLLAPPRHGAGLAEQILAAMQMAEEQVRHMTAAAKTNVEVNFTDDAMVEGTLSVYRRLLAEPKNG